MWVIATCSVQWVHHQLIHISRITNHQNIMSQLPKLFLPDMVRLLDYPQFNCFVSECVLVFSVCIMKILFLFWSFVICGWCPFLVQLHFCLRRTIFLIGRKLYFSLFELCYIYCIIFLCLFCPWWWSWDQKMWITCS